MYLKDIKRDYFTPTLKGTRHTTRDKATFRAAVFHASQSALARMRKPDSEEDAKLHFDLGEASRQAAVSTVARLLNTPGRGLRCYEIDEADKLACIGVFRSDAEVTYNVTVEDIQSVYVVLAGYGDAAHQLVVHFRTKEDPELRSIYIDLDTKSWFLREGQEEEYAKTGEVTA